MGERALVSARTEVHMLATVVLSINEPEVSTASQVMRFNKVRKRKDTHAKRRNY